MLRSLYALAGTLLLPFLLLKIWWRGRAEPGYRLAWWERLGFYRDEAPPTAPLIWVHAVSLGETHAARPLLEGLLAAFPEATILLTHLTATGREAGQKLCGERVRQAWLPWDTPAASRRFLAHFRPLAGILLETEIWPCLIGQAKARGMPVYLVNARLSEKSAAGYRRLGSFARAVFAGLAGVAAQSEADAARLAELGAPLPVVTGNLKFDLALPEDAAPRAEALRRGWASRSVVWVAGSTREGEEELLLRAMRREALAAEILTVMVPRHPQRFAEVAALLERLGVRYQRRSEEKPLAPDTRVILGDSMGEMPVYYAASDFVFMGGSLLPFGCQNLIEACAAGRPVLLGPSVYNFAQAAELALAQGAAAQVQDAEALLHTVAAWAQAPALRARMGEAASAFAKAHRGASARLLTWLTPRLRERFSSPRDSG